MTLADLRREYAGRPLGRKDLHPNPLRQFQQWFEEALKAKIVDANAMTLATVSPEGIPSARTMLLKDAGTAGFTFYTNYDSRKGHDLSQNPQAAIVFYWPEISRQVRITGNVTKVSRKRSETYFHSRPRGSQLAALASRQSRPLSNRQELEDRISKLAARHREEPVPLPESWGGYRLKPHEYEFWQGRENRLHDRFRYRHENNSWVIERLQP